MAEALVAVTEGIGKQLHGWSRTISAQLVQDEFVLPGEFPYASYTVVGSAVSAATVNSHLLQLMAGASLNVRIRRIFFRQRVVAGAAAVMGLQIMRLTTAGTGGGAVTPGKLDTADAASGATAMTLPSSKGTESTILYDFTMPVYLTPPMLYEYTWEQRRDSKPIIIPAGTANGLAIKNTTAIATATWDINIEIVETAFV